MLIFHNYLILLVLLLEKIFINKKLMKINFMEIYL